MVLIQLHTIGTRFGGARRLPHSLALLDLDGLRVVLVSFIT